MSTEYEDLADEYYDEQAHPTIALLRGGSQAALEAFASSLLLVGTLFAEVGSGRGMLHNFAHGRHVISFDLNPGMLRHAPGFGVVGDATALPVLDATFDGLFASLCDPYNTPRFLAEARRVLRPGGRLLMTVPNHAWVRHNQAHEGILNAAVVVGRRGPIIVPSYVRAPDEQIQLLADHGFASVKVFHAPLVEVVKAIGMTSPRLLDSSGRPLSPHVTDAYLAW